MERTVLVMIQVPVEAANAILASHEAGKEQRLICSRQEAIEIMSQTIRDNRGCFDEVIAGRVLDALDNGGESWQFKLWTEPDHLRAVMRDLEA